jgi:hypothetical protein
MVLVAESGNSVSKPFFEALLGWRPSPRRPGLAETASSFSCSTTLAGTRDQRRGSRGNPLALLPAYTPELQPAEHLWQTVDEPIVNKRIPNLETLEVIVFQRCAQLSDDRQP